MPYSPYSNYKGRCVGRVLHFLYHYCGLTIAERAIISFAPSEVKYGNELLASYRWLGDTDIPVFTFVDKLENSHWSTEHMERKQNEALYWRDVLTDVFSPDEIPGVKAWMMKETATTASGTGTETHSRTAKP